MSTPGPFFIMKRHTLLYINHFGYDTSDFIPCEVCGSKAVDIHHIDARGMGSSKMADRADNLMALCRSCHIEYGDKKQYKDFLRTVHEKISR